MLGPAPGMTATEPERRSTISILWYDSAKRSMWSESTVIFTKLTNDYREVCDHLHIAKDRGYTDAYVVGRAML